MGESSVICDGGLEYACVSEVGGRLQNQDRFLVLSDSEKAIYLFAVADGMGGHRAGGEAAEAAVSALRGHWAEVHRQPNLQDWIRSLFRHAHRSVQDLAISGERAAPQTTLALLLFAGGEVWSGHVGDSRVIHYSRSGLKGRTRDHSVTEVKLAAGKISEQEAAVDRDRNLLTMALGGAREPEPDITRWRMAQGDIFCLASDGAWALLSDGDFVGFTTAGDLQQAADQVMGLQLSRAPAGQDNATIVVVRRPQ
ncbi:MAG: PP2C family serine/threonine-protein phosphatase [Halieaceae bacterium]|nr:PP2C family serine/threonine-protein phosphatase [Halieaceae bacterium]